MAFTIDNSLVEVEGSGGGGIFKFCHRGGTANVRDVTLSIIIDSIDVNSRIELEVQVKKPGKEEAERVIQPGIDAVTGEIMDAPLVFRTVGKYEINLTPNVSTDDVCYALKVIGSVDARLSSNLESAK